jgi:signal transduction histidine kinase
MYSFPGTLQRLYSWKKDDFRSCMRPQSTTILAYAVAMLSVTAALVVGYLLDRFVHTEPYVSLFLCAIMFAAWFGGLGPSLLATVTASLSFIYFFVGADSVGIAPNDIPRIVLFGITALFVVSIMAAQRRNEESLWRARDRLQGALQEQARLVKALRAENAKRRRVQAYLDEAQRLSRTGTFSWKLATGDIFWSKEGCRMMAAGATGVPPIDALLQWVHKDDLPIVQHEFERVRRGELEYDYEFRWLPPTGAARHLHIRAHRVRLESGDDEIVGALMDVSEAHEAQECQHAAQTALAHAARVATLGEISASIAHEFNQPLAGIVTNGEAALRWLDRGEPELGEARNAIARMVHDGERASQVIKRLRALARKAPAQTMRLDLNEVVAESIALVEREIHNRRAALQIDLASSLPPVIADWLELQQVVINLLANGVQAMEVVTDRPRHLVVRSFAQADEVVVSVRDSGIGIDPLKMKHLFNAFFTTKVDGMGMGLSICRSIIESHGGRIWASNNTGSGMTFQFALPLRGGGTS